MRFRTLALSTVIASVGLVSLTAARISIRDRAAKADHPPVGQLLGQKGEQVHVLVEGDGPDLVLIHGANGNLRDFTMGLSAELAQFYRVIAVDRPGLGYSDPLDNGETSPMAQARRIRDAVQELGVDKPLVLGQSYGGAVALAWALEAPPSALILVSGASMPWPGTLDPWYRLTDTAVGRYTLVPLAAAFVPKAYVEKSIEAVFAPQAAPEGYAEHIGVDLTLRFRSLAANVAQVNALREHIVQMEKDYSGLALPVELVHGDADTIVPLSVHAEKLAPLLPQGNLTVIPGAGHMPHHTHKGQVIAAIHRAAQRAGLR